MGNHKFQRVKKLKKIDQKISANHKKLVKYWCNRGHKSKFKSCERKKRKRK